jgi:hypothetical protein
MEDAKNHPDVGPTIQDAIERYRHKYLKVRCFLTMHSFLSSYLHVFIYR